MKKLKLREGKLKLSWSSSWKDPSIWLLVGRTWIQIFLTPKPTITVLCHSVIVKSEISWYRIPQNNFCPSLSVMNPQETDLNDSQPPLLSGFPTAPSPWQLEAASFPAPTWPSWELWGWDASSDWDSPGIPTLAPSCTWISEGVLQAPGTLAGILLACCCRGYTAPPGSSPLPTYPPFPLLPLASTASQLHILTPLHPSQHLDPTLPHFQLKPGAQHGEQAAHLPEAPALG